MLLPWGRIQEAGDKIRHPKNGLGLSDEAGKNCVHSRLHVCDSNARTKKNLFTGIDEPNLRLLQKIYRHGPMPLRHVFTSFVSRQGMTVTRFRFILFTLFIPLFFASLSKAETTSTSSLTLEEVLDVAQKNNPEIRAAQKKWNAAQARISIEKTWDKPQISYERMYSGDEKLIGISQEFPFPGKLSLKGKVASKEAVMAEQGYLAKEREVRSKVKSAYAMYFLTVKSIEIFQKNAELMRHFAKVSESKYSVGKVSQTDVLRAQIELSKMLNMLVTLNQEKETAQAMLNTLLNRRPQNPLGVPQEIQIKRFDQSLEDLQNMALTTRPELLESKTAVERSQKALTSSKFEYLPDIMAQYKRRQAMSPELDNTSDVMVGLTVPLWFWKQKSMVQMAEADKEMSDAEYQTMQNMTLFGVKDLLVKAQTAERLVDLYRTSVLPQAEQALTVSDSAYQADRISFLELIDVQRNLLQFQVEHYQHLAEYEQWSAELERIIGKDLWEVKQ